LIKGMHTVEFYPAGAFPERRIAQAMRTALDRGHAAFAIARPERLERLRALVGQDAGLSLLDAEQIANAAADGELVEPQVLAERVLAPLRQSLARHGQAYVFGEIVDILVQRGQRAAAIATEEWWNHVLPGQPIELHCAYALSGFADAAGAAPFRTICDAHTPTREYLGGLRRVMTSLGAAISISELARIADFEARSQLHATGVALYVDELGHWRDLISGATVAVLPRDGVVLPLEVRGHSIGALALTVDTPRAPAWHALAGDIAQQVALALDRARTLDAIERASRAKDEFLAMLGHELRNPLAPIVTALQLARLRGETAMQHERAVIERQVHHLVRLIDDLLDVARISRGKVSLERRAVEIADVVARAVEQTQPVIAEAGHELRVDAQPGIVAEVDPERLAQVIVNLVTNAARFTPAGGRLELAATADPARITIRMRDNGGGIAPELLPHVFEMFIQGEQGRDRARGGLGVGLAIAKSIVELHGGVIRVESAGPGTGSVFTVELPRLPHVKHPAVPAPAARTTAPRRIVLVDDNRDACELLAEAMRDLGHEVHIAHDGNSGLRVATEVVPDVAILDLGLPGMDGYELARALRETLSERAPRLIALSGYGQPEDRRRSAEAGFSAHLVKPTSLDAIEELIG
jgi:signal transduction histidine kinase